MIKLSVNINKIALLRNQRDIGIPDVVESARTVIDAGAYGVTIHPRPDERHIRYSDAYEIAELVRQYPDIEFNIEGNPFAGKYMEIVCELKPDQATLVPDAPGAVTSDHGWDLKGQEKKLGPVIEELKKANIRISLFMDPVKEQIKAAKEYGADRVELYTEPYARAFRLNKGLEDVLESYVQAGAYACDIGLGLNAGHDLNLKNLPKFCSSIHGLMEVSIGHALIADALEMGLSDAVKAYLKVISETESKE
ncbi:MAG: pyridoxine 5'-phosphate synthase [Planctomycetota bacterium]